jgi:hypothetical protein
MVNGSSNMKLLNNVLGQLSGHMSNALEHKLEESLVFYYSASDESLDWMNHYNYSMNGLLLYKFQTRVFGNL